jgi:hypothetical protein
LLDPYASSRREPSLNTSFGLLDPCASSRREPSLNISFGSLDPCASSRREPSLDTSFGLLDPCASSRREPSLDVSFGLLDPYASSRREPSLNTSFGLLDPCASSRRLFSSLTHLCAFVHCEPTFMVGCCPAVFISMRYPADYTLIQRVGSPISAGLTLANYSHIGFVDMQFFSSDQSFTNCIIVAHSFALAGGVSSKAIAAI